MTPKDNVIERRTVTPDGFLLGGLGVLIFSVSLPATRVAVGELDPWFVAFGRAAVAGVLSIGYLASVRAPLPSRTQVLRLLVVALGIVFGFPLLSSLALQVETSAHGAVVIAALPMATAIFAVLRAGERPPRAFWLASIAGLIAVLVFVVTTGAATGGIGPGDGFLLATVVLGGLGYAEGGALSKELGGARTICWALVLSLPITVAVGVARWDPTHASGSAWLSFGYVSLGSMFLGFFAWYAGMARGGVAKVGQVQLAQPVLTLIWAALLLHERVTAWTVVAALAVLGCVVLTQRTRAGQPPAQGTGTQLSRTR